jgi:hypothetical protein
MYNYKADLSPPQVVPSFQPHTYALRCSSPRIDGQVHSSSRHKDGSKKLRLA